MNNLYDTIGLNYANLRRPDYRIAAQIDAALGRSKTVLNVGAGTGSYEPVGRVVTAIEPSAKMIAQRAPSNTTVIQGSAENLPFADNTFDASMAVLTIHHWSDPAKGVTEMRRVTKGKVVFLTFDPEYPWFWLADYFPALVTLDNKQMPNLARYSEWLGDVEVTPVPIPHDCWDGFLAGYWRRPNAYIEDRVRAAMSSFWALDDIEQGLANLSADLQNGTWEAKYGHLLHLTELDCGYRLVQTK